MCSNRVDPLANPLLKTWSRWWKDKKGDLWYMSTFSMTESEVTEWWIRNDDLQQEPQTVQPPQKKKQGRATSQATYLGVARQVQVAQSHQGHPKWS